MRFVAARDVPMVKITKTQSGASAVSLKFIGEIREDVDEHTLERAASFAGTDFALELRENKLLLFAVRG